jgi:hypothetical protein
VVERLIAAGADVTKANADGVTPLAIARKNLKGSVVKKLRAAEPPKPAPQCDA